jgi:hypothetical protein
VAPRKPAEGDSFRLTEPVGQGTGALYPGQVVTVREVVPAKEPGAHDFSEDAVVVTWDEPAPVLDDEGNYAQGTVARAWSCGLAEFRRIFEGA